MLSFQILLIALVIQLIGLPEVGISGAILQIIKWVFSLVLLDHLVKKVALASAYGHTCALACVVLMFFSSSSRKFMPVQ